MSFGNASEPTVIVIVGPTCTGKTALSISLAQLYDGEVIGCDSRTIYKYMDIGTAKPSLAERMDIPHHLFDIVEPSCHFTVAQYKELATQSIRQIASHGRIPIVCGGTGLYARALLEGFEIPAVEPQPHLREELTAYAEEHGNEKLHERLREMDAATASRLNQNDRFRVIRALEVSIVSGKPFSELTARGAPPFKTIWIGLTVKDRAHLRGLIEKRMNAQLESGLLEEVRRLYHQYGCTRVLMNAVNYKEFIAYFHGQLSYEAAVQECMRHNSQLARRQIMWFKANAAINWLEIDLLSTQQLLTHAKQLFDDESIHR